MKKLALLACTLLLLPGCAARPQRVVPVADANPLGPAAQSDLYLGVVEGLIRQQRYQAAIAFLAKYQRSGAPTPRFLKLTGDALSGAGRYDEAIASYRGALGSDLAAAAYDGIARAQSARGNWAEAARNFRQATLLDPSNADYLNNLGYAQLKQGLKGAGLDTAVSALERAHELAPDSIRIRNNLALAAASSGDRAQLHTLLDTIPDGGRRKLLADFAQNWTPAWQDNAATAEGKTP